MSRHPSSATLQFVTVLGLGVALVINAAAQPALDIAARTGEIIGAAAACGMEAGDLLTVGYKVIGWTRKARAAHEAAVTRGAVRIEKAGPGACPAAVAAFRDLQGEAP